jgi:hypothetical protein
MTGAPQAIRWALSTHASHQPYPEPGWYLKPGY